MPTDNKIFDEKMVNHTIDIYYFTPSPPSRATLMLVKALGIKHSIKTVNILNGEHLKAEFMKFNPLHTIPVIDDRGFVLWDSHVIMKYLSQKYAKDDSLYPNDPKRAALVDRALYFEATTLFPRFGQLLAPVLIGKYPPSDVFDNINNALEVLNNFLEGQAYVAGNNLTIGDFSIISLIATFDAMGAFNLRKFDNIWQWYQRCKLTMKPFGYSEINEEGANVLGTIFKSKVPPK